MICTFRRLCNCVVVGGVDGPVGWTLESGDDDIVVEREVSR